MRRRHALIAAMAVLVVLAAAVWYVSRRGAPGPDTEPEPSPAAVPTVPPPEDWHAALGLYAAPNGALPTGVDRLEITLTKAELQDDDGRRAVVFQGGRRLMLQAGIVQKLLSDPMPQGAWDRVALTFSPAAEAVTKDGALTVFLEKREAVYALDADVPLSRTLAAFVRVASGAAVERKNGVPTLSIGDSSAAETYVLGGIFLDPRGLGEIFRLDAPTLASVVQADLDLDIVRTNGGSKGYVPPTSGPGDAVKP